MSQPRIVVIGASAGGLAILKKLAEQLPDDFRASVFIVVHMAATSSAENVIFSLQKHTSLLCKVAENKELIQPGVIYLAPADHHLLISGNYIFVTQGPRENQFRPSIDPLFRSAASSFGPAVIGVVLTGMLQDGTVGMDAVKRSGGIAVVQDPMDAEFPDMPLSVMRNVSVDHVVTMENLASLLVELVQKPVNTDHEIPEDIKLEAKIAERVMGTTEEVEKLGKKVEFTCPDCGGNLWEMTNGSVLRYRCHLGHAFTAGALLKDMNDAMEETLWIALRMMEERKNLLTTMLEREQNVAPNSWVAGQRERVEEIKVHINRIREVLMVNQNPDTPERAKKVN